MVEYRPKWKGPRSKSSRYTMMVMEKKELRMMWSHGSLEITDPGGWKNSDPREMRHIRIRLCRPMGIRRKYYTLELEKIYPW